MVKWSSQLYLQILARKKITGLQWDSNPWPKICSCLSTTAMTTSLFRLYSRSSNQLNLTRAKRFFVKCTFMSRLCFPVNIGTFYLISLSITTWRGCFLTKRFISPTLIKNRHKKKIVYATDGNGLYGSSFLYSSTKSAKSSSPIVITNTRRVERGTVRNESCNENIVEQEWGQELIFTLAALVFI